MIQSSGNDVVDQMARFNPTGVIIPHTWFMTIQKSGKPYMPAIVVLAEIVYWYRPSEIKEEHTGRLIGYKKRFKADKLQKSANGLAETFGFTKKQVLDALTYLKKSGYIQIELRNITTGDGMKLSNVRFVDINVEAIENLTYPMTYKSHPITSKSQGYDLQVTGVSPTSHTNTEITVTEITNTLSSSSEAQTEPETELVFKTYLSNIAHNMTPIEQSKLLDDIETFGSEMVIFAIEEAVTNNKRSYKYMEAIMRSWSDDKVTTLEGAKLRSQKWAENAAAKSNGRGYGRNRKPVSNMKAPAWIEGEKEKRTAYEKAKKEEFEAEVPSEDEIDKILADLGGNTNGSDTQKNAHH